MGPFMEIFRSPDQHSAQYEEEQLRAGATARPKRQSQLEDLVDAKSASPDHQAELQELIKERIRLGELDKFGNPAR
jgi:hypothetical protein